nr:MAG TPA: hypothetical protein [Caudoviricetes sp.]
MRCQFFELYFIVFILENSYLCDFSGYKDK